MACEETDKALAELLRKLPKASVTVAFLAFWAFVLYLANRNSALSKSNNHFRDTPAQQTSQDRQTPAKQTSAQGTRDPQKAFPPPPPILKASDHINDGKHHLLLCATGSVATIKLPSIISALSTYSNLSIRVLLTPSACEFLQSQSPEQPSLASISHLPNVDGLYLDADEWRKPWVRGDSILHIELRRWADLMVIAPLSANALAKIALGMSDSMVYSVARAWDTTGMIDAARPGVRLPYAAVIEGVEDARKKGIVVAPAMNTAMWNHPVTKRHLDVLEGEWNVRNGGWVEVLRPIDKGLACGDKGGGAMREWKEIVHVVEERLGLKSSDEKQRKEDSEAEGYVAADRR
ncbi:hypothetical protein CBER1_05885 [Cercospora berteroae]|uniref:Flavoprotein domain-containing protein n=1 Tax=Cercospora berteroae TaxID=357750 RepID=A0A2S6C7J0_9PEZI|nr:hypothetical protein CBER1_05885 [Cercospora berteroae]